MATQVQWRRGTTTQVAAFTGAVGEIVVDTTTWQMSVQDGFTPGGHYTGSASGGTFNNIVLTGDTNDFTAAIVLGGTFNGPTINTPIVNNPTVTGGTFASPTLTGIPVTAQPLPGSASSQIPTTLWVRQTILQSSPINLPLAAASALIY